jgi:hypothetical protein
MCAWWLWMYIESSVWILLAMAGVPVVPWGWHPCAGVLLFVFPPLLVGVELGCECGGCRFLQAPVPLLVPSS